MASGAWNPWRASHAQMTTGLRTARLLRPFAVARNCASHARPGRAGCIGSGSAAILSLVATSAGVAWRSCRTAMFVRRRVRRRHISHPQVRTFPRPSLNSEWIYGVPSGLPEFDERVKAVPGEVTLLDVEVSSQASTGLAASAEAAEKLVWTWVSALACRESCKFDIFCDYAQPEQLIWKLQHYGKKSPTDQLVWIFQHFNCQHVDATSFLADAFMAMQPTVDTGTAMRGVVILLGDAAKENYQLRQLEAARLKQLARATDMHVWVARLSGHEHDLCDELQNISDNYVTVEGTDTEAKVCVRKVRNQFAGNVSLQPWCMKYCCSTDAPSTRA
eukprot:TRINITY_DN30929_c0_g1_i1.p1 TRINITY_DN30929_c0_g1~~TRINITY_DN30929_c0_g1_i1.p1  ORF type:complete len:332 (+),score=44.88 TRINITY_DN30929_c0_g1_i1:74-1069(+)